MPHRWIDALIKPSTRAFYTEGRKLKPYRFFDFLHGYVYARWTYLYIGLGLGEHPLAKKIKPLTNAVSQLLFRPSKTDADQAAVTGFTPAGMAFANTYHGKVLPLDSARQLVSVREEIHKPDLEQVIPYSTARAIILKNPDHIAVIDCPCRVARANPCLPLDVCLIVGEPFTSFVIEHHPTRSRRITQAEAAQILEAEDRRGHVHHAFLKDAMLGRFYAICNCCQCCCGAMHAQRTGSPMLASSGYVAEIDADLCIACGNCADHCQFNAITMQDERAAIDAAACMGCAVCSHHCPQDAISLRLEPARGIPLDVLALLEPSP